MTPSSMEVIITLLAGVILLALGPANGEVLDSDHGHSVKISSSNSSADSSAEQKLASCQRERANWECPAVCPACPAVPGCPACPDHPGCPSPPPCPRHIPPGYLYYENLGYYKMHYETKSWIDAKAACEREGGYLAVLNSQSEADLALKFMSRHGVIKFIHIGFFDVTKSKNYITVLDQSLASTGYEVWANGQPDNVGIENCGSFLLGQTTTGLNDIKCDEDIMSFLCELFT